MKAYLLQRICSLNLLVSSVILTAFIGWILITSAVAQDAQPLTDGASRGELFEYLGQITEGQLPAADFTQFAFRAAFRFPHDTRWKNPVLEQDPRTNQLFGVDVSHHNTDSCRCEINWQKLAEQNVTFAYLKATQGVGYYDKSFAANLVGIRSVSGGRTIAVGAYHFLTADGPADGQADTFLKTIENKLGSNDLAPVLDLEWDVKTQNGKIIKGPDGRAKDFWEPYDGKTILAKTLRWLKIVEDKTGKKPIVYTSQAWWNERMNGVGAIPDALQGYRIWITDLSSKGLKLEAPYAYKGSWSIWQFTFIATMENGGLPSGGKVDASLFDGSPQDLATALK